MAATSTKMQSTMLLKYKTGVDAKGKDILKNERFSKLKVNAKDEDILAVANVIAALMAYPVSHVLREDQSAIING